MIIIAICAVLFVWAAVDWYLASQKLTWLWIVTPFAWLLLAMGCAFLAGPAALSVVDRPLPIEGKLYIFPAAVLVAAAGMVLNSLKFWMGAAGQIWSRIS